MVVASWQRFLPPPATLVDQAAVGDVVGQILERTRQDHSPPPVVMIVLQQGEQVRGQNRRRVQFVLSGENPQNQPRLFYQLPGSQSQMVDPGRESQGIAGQILRQG
jgi:hypothetical protein